ncbi:Uncharacterised protein [Jonesia denitrificans]|nr:Uncharacterised protein [Jonesia denitrificans]
MAAPGLGYPGSITQPAHEKARTRNNTRVRAFINRFQDRARSRGSEVPVLVFGVDGFPNDVGGARTGEEVVVFVGVG